MVPRIHPLPTIAEPGPDDEHVTVIDPNGDYVPGRTGESWAGVSLLYVSGMDLRNDFVTYVSGIDHQEVEAPSGFAPEMEVL